MTSLPTCDRPADQLVIRLPRRRMRLTCSHNCHHGRDNHLPRRHASLQLRSIHEGTLRTRTTTNARTPTLTAAGSAPDTGT
jgi:hypothetical protein